MSPALEAILQHPAVWRGGACARVETPGIASGYAQLDHLLPGSGWPTAALTEILCAQEGIGELTLLAPALAHLSKQGRWIFFIAPPFVPYAPALSAAGIRLESLLIVRAGAKDSLWAMEQVLRSNACAAALAWPRGAEIKDQELRRLQLAAEAGRSMAIIYRSSKTAAQASPAALRLALAPERECLRVEILKRRGTLIEAPLRIKLAERLARPSAMAAPSLERV